MEIKITSSNKVSGFKKHLTENGKTFFLSFGIIAFGVLVFTLLTVLRKAPEKKVNKNPGLLIEAHEISNTNHQAKIYGTGIVSPKKEIDLIPEVSGKIIYISEEFVEGGIINKGEIIFKIEATEYKADYEQAKATLANAEIDYETVKSRASIARKEWEDLKIDEEPNPLVLYKPQLKEAEAKINSAKAAVAKAKLNVERTVYRAPFNCIIREDNVDIGQYVKSGTSIGKISGTQMAEVIVPLPLYETGWIMYGQENSNKGSEAEIGIPINGKKYIRTGNVARLIGELDEVGRMARIVIDVNDPYNLKKKTEKNKRLLFGMYVDVIINGISINDVAVIPKEGLRENNMVWLVDENDKLKMKKIEIVRLEKNLAVIRGVNNGEQIITTNIIGAANGMKLRVAAKVE